MSQVLQMGKKQKQGPSSHYASGMLHSMLTALKWPLYIIKCEAYIGPILVILKMGDNQQKTNKQST